MNKLFAALLTAAFAASPVLAQTTIGPVTKDEKKAEAKKDAAPAKAEAKKDAAPAAAEAKKDEKKKPKGGC
jgi:hypothetical protein